MVDSRKKSILKTFSWRVLAIVISFGVAWFFTKSVSISIGLVLTANILSMIAYYFHERIWAKYK